MHLEQQRCLGKDISFAADCPDYPSDSAALVLSVRSDARLLLELRVRAVRVVDKLLVEGKGLHIHESLAATIALHRSIQLQADVLEGSVSSPPMC